MAQRFERLREVIGRTGLSRSSIYRRATEGTFPKPVQLGPNTVAWVGAEVDQWMDEQVAASRGEGHQRDNAA